MILLDLTKAEFKAKEKWPLLYVITEIYVKNALPKKPLKDTEVVEIAKREYGLVLERRTVSRYRAYLEKHFGLSFQTDKKGHFLQNYTPSIERFLRLNPNYSDCFINYDEEEKEFEEIVKKIAIIIDAMKKGKCIKLGISFCLGPKKDGKGSIALEEKTLLVHPQKIFRFQNQYYLLSIIKGSDQYFINLIRSCEIKRSSSKDRLFPNSSSDRFLNRYMEDQDFIFTGPADLGEPKNKKSHRFSTEKETMSLILRFSQSSDGKPYPYWLPQAIIELYGEKKVRAYYGHSIVKHFSQNSNFVETLNLEFPIDEKTKAIEEKIKAYPSDFIRVSTD